MEFTASLLRDAIGRGLSGAVGEKLVRGLLASLRLYVEPIRDVRERELQQKLLDVANDARLTIDGRRLLFALQPCIPPRKSGPRRINTK